MGSHQTVNLLRMHQKELISLLKIFGHFDSFQNMRMRKCTNQKSNVENITSEHEFKGFDQYVFPFGRQYSKTKNQI